MNSNRDKLSAIPPDLLCLADYADRARQFLDPPVAAWLAGGSGDEQALRANSAAFAGHAIYNRVLADMRGASTRTSLLGHDLPHPVILAPLGYHRLAHPEGEAATARGCLDTILTVSTMASVAVEDIARAAIAPLWFQLYFQPERDATLSLLHRAETAGVTAIVVTLDTPVQPAPLAAQKAGFAIPHGVEAVHLKDLPTPPEIRIARGDSLVFQGMMARAPGWDDLRWLRDQTRLPLIVKGVSHPDDARILAAEGVDGLVLSNHGGRALNAAPAPLHALPAIRAAVGPVLPLLIDGGARSGADIFKAIALGANAVMVGRPQLHALAIAGSLGVAHMLRLLREELEIVMALAGQPSIAGIGPECLRPAKGEASC